MKTMYEIEKYAQKNYRQVVMLRLAQVGFTIIITQVQ